MIGSSKQIQLTSKTKTSKEKTPTILSNSKEFYSLSPVNNIEVL